MTEGGWSSHAPWPELHGSSDAKVVAATTNDNVTGEFNAPLNRRVIRVAAVLPRRMLIAKVSGTPGSVQGARPIVLNSWLVVNLERYISPRRVGPA